MRSIIIRGAVIFGLLVLGLPALLGILGVLAFVLLAPDCTPVRDSTISPNGAWVVEGVVDLCEGGGLLGVQLRRPKEASPDRKNYILAARFDRPMSKAVLFRWIDDANLSIVLPQGSGVDPGPGEFRGIRVTYEDYRDDPGVSRSASMPRTTEVQSSFIPSFEKTERATGWRDTCTLWLKAKDGQYFENVSLRISAVKDWPTGVRPSERNDFSVAFQVDQPARSPVMKMTSAKLDDIFPAPSIVSRLFRPPDVDTQRFPLYQLWYRGYSEDDIARMIIKLRQPTFAVKLGFWLDEVVLNYVSSTPIADGPLTEYETCLRQHGILNRPLESPSH